MSWTQVFVLSSLTTLLIIITFSSVTEGAAVRHNSKADNPKGEARQVFVPGSDASRFLKRRSRRSTRYYESQAEQKVKMAQTERWREYNEEQMDEHAHYAREERDEQSERSREVGEQYREYHYDGFSPQYYWFH